MAEDVTDVFGLPAKGSVVDPETFGFPASGSVCVDPTVVAVDILAFAKILPTLGAVEPLRGEIVAVPISVVNTGPSAL